MNPLEKIDKIFNFIKERSDSSSNFSKEYIWNLYARRIPELDVDRQLYEEILKKLSDDGYIREEKINSSQSTYHVTFEGLTFDGYVNEELNNQKEFQEVRNLRQATVRLQKGLNRLTFWIVVGTSVAAAYYILEILNHFFCIYPK